MALSKELKPYLVLYRYLNCLLKASMILFEISSLKLSTRIFSALFPKCLPLGQNRLKNTEAARFPKNNTTNGAYTYPEKDTTQPWRRFRAQFSLMPYCSAAAYFVSSPSYIRRPMSSRSSKEYFMITSCHRTDSQ